MKIAICFAVFVGASAAAQAQTTQGMITGRVYDRQKGDAIEGATIETRNQQTGEGARTSSGAGGYYALLRLAPGTYWIRVTGPKVGATALYQPGEAFELELRVAGRLQIDIPLRKSADTYGRELYSSAYLPKTAIVHMYAADLETTVSEALTPLIGTSGALLSTLSYVVDPGQVRNLPLSGRDIYTILVTLPGVTADNATARGLGLSANGQRSYSANYLLDGVENNDRLLSGPLTPIAPEAIQEYRVSTNNFSAEYGGQSGLVANAVTRAGTSTWHGIGYAYLNDTMLDANSFQHLGGLNTSTGERGDEVLPRQPQTDVFTGFWLGGPLSKKKWKNRLFGSAAFESLRSRGSRDVFPFQVPVLSSFQALYRNHQSLAWLQQYQPPVPQDMALSHSGPLSTTYNARIPIQFNRKLSLGRLDYISGDQRFLARISASRADQPDFIYSIYPDFSSTLNVDSTSAALVYGKSRGEAENNEFRLGYRNDSQGWNRPHPEIPVLVTSVDGSTNHPFGIWLPGSPSDNSFGYRDNTGELSDIYTLARGRQIMTVGGGLQIRNYTTLLDFQAYGHYSFRDLAYFGLDAPDNLQVTVARQGPDAMPAYGVKPTYGNKISRHEFYGFVQDSIKVTPRLEVNLGVRYEAFGAPRTTGGETGYFQPGPGLSPDQRLATGTMAFTSSPHSLYRPDHGNWAGRFGVSYDLFSTGHTVLRGAYGVFYDRPFDLLTLSALENNFDSVQLAGAYPGISRSPGGVSSVDLSSPPLLWVDGNLRTPLVQSWFGGIQQYVSKDFYIEVQGQGALGRHLIGTDFVNRVAALSYGSNTLGRLNQSLAEDIYFRSNWVSSSYNALTALMRYQNRRSQTQLAYTWAHSIDNQSDPLQGNFDDLQTSRASNTDRGINRAGFTRQFQPGADRANSDFDQRHNLVMFSIWDIGVRGRGRASRLLLEDWQVSGIAGFRSGFPFNVISSNLLQACPGSNVNSYTQILRNRPNLVPGVDPFFAHRQPVPGGDQLLNPAAFCDPGADSVGTLGRNALAGPGFWNVDLSLSKSFRPRFLGESGAIRFRADFFNAFNHANLGNPDGLAGSLTFGQAMLGRQGVQPSFPSVMPLDQLARQAQLQLKVLF